MPSDQLTGLCSDRRYGDVVALLDVLDNGSGNTAVDKALTVLEAIAARGPVGVSEVARETSLAKSTAFRALTILEDRGYVSRAEGGYQVGPTLYKTASNAWSRRMGAVRDAILPYMIEVYEATHEVVHLAALTGTQVFYVEKLHGSRPVRCPSRVGETMPAYCTAVGKVLICADQRVAEEISSAPLVARTPRTITDPRMLARSLAEVRRSRIAFDIEECAPNLVCAAVPIVDRRGRAICALSVAGTRGRFEPRTIAQLLRATGAAASAAVARVQASESSSPMGHWPSVPAAYVTRHGPTPRAQVARGPLK